MKGDGEKVCNPDYPVLFTDVAKYRSWIKAAVGEELLDIDVTKPPLF
jgi:secreted trypsin-like serine protease